MKTTFLTKFLPLLPAGRHQQSHRPQQPIAIAGAASSAPSSSAGTSMLSSSPESQRASNVSPCPAPLSALPRTISRQTAVTLAKRFHPFAQTLSDRQVLHYGVPVQRLSQEVSLLTLAKHRRLLLLQRYPALALSYSAAEQQRHTDLLQMADIHLDCLQQWARAFVGGYAHKFEARHVIETADRRQVHSREEMLRLWCHELQNTLREVGEYERWRSQVDPHPAYPSVPESLMERMDEVCALFENVDWQAESLAPAARSQLLSLLTPPPVVREVEPVLFEPSLVGVGLGVSVPEPA